MLPESSSCPQPANSRNLVPISLENPVQFILSPCIWMNAYLEAAIDEGVVDDLVGGEGDLVVVLGVDVAVDPRHLVHEEVHKEEEEVVGPQAGTHTQDDLQIEDSQDNKL